MLTRIRVLFRRIFGRFGLLDNLYYRATDPIRRISSAHRPFRIAFNLIWPLHRIHYALPPSPTPLEILERREIAEEYLHRDGHYHQLRSLRYFAARDTSIRSLYRLCVSVCAQDQNEIMLESQYFWRHNDWAIHDIPDPRDPDPVRYAMLASIVEELVDAFNYKVGLGLRRGAAIYDRAAANEEAPSFEVCPEWASQVLGLDNLINFCQEGDQGMPAFRKRNIIVDVSQFRNI
ncbi:DNA-binding protein, putative [Rhizoctonia solani AG-3 Rhs1AP]|uniref:DNA-binding protein, putative n=1 Tax=Rhizoctonia solani AG-3 Rhs1AP TaxID=1086054 RepID=X8JWH3_9AGAM|nr:DNA-binding protein, putative [Rhizoctonia solani AG-3 Rhs1AP]